MQTTVASVGPKRLSTTLFGAAAFHIEADATGSGSPAKKEYRRLLMEFGASNFMRCMLAAMEGTVKTIVGLMPLNERRWSHHLRRRNDKKRRAVLPGDKKVEHGNVESDFRNARHAIRWLNCILQLHRFDKMIHRTDGDHDAFRDSRRAGSENDVGGVVRAKLRPACPRHRKPEAHRGPKLLFLYHRPAGVPMTWEFREPECFAGRG